jgi:hypothetical protein
MAIQNLHRMRFFSSKNVLTFRSTSTSQSRSMASLPLDTHAIPIPMPMSSIEYNYAGSTIPSMPSNNFTSDSSFSSGSSPSNNARFPRRRQNPPRPPSGSSPLPTIDASPLMNPNVYIKRTSKASHSIAGPDATKRLFSAKDKICSWIWNQILHGDKAVPLIDTHKDSAGNAINNGNDSNAEETETSIGFMVVGHGVPYQLLQDHVDCAWNMLNDASTRGSTEEGEVMECNFYNDTKSLQFDWIKLRKRDNTISNYPLNTNTHVQNHNTDQELYLTVMNRLSTTFGTILETQPPPTTINTDKYWKKDILNPMSCWRVTFKRGFVFPPSATSTSFDNESHFSHGGKVKEERREFWTGPPIVELIPARKRTHGRGMVMVNGLELELELDGEKEGEDSHDKSEKEESNANFVRVTLQGIPSVFWQEQESDSGVRVRKDDMVPLSLVFEACFEPEARE